jgi:hypothetical protein
VEPVLHHLPGVDCGTAIKALPGLPRLDDCQEPRVAYADLLRPTYAKNKARAFPGALTF